MRQRTSVTPLHPILNKKFHPQRSFLQDDTTLMAERETKEPLDEGERGE